MQAQEQADVTPSGGIVTRIASSRQWLVRTVLTTILVVLAALVVAGGVTAAGGEAGAELTTTEVAVTSEHPGLATTTVQQPAGVGSPVLLSGETTVPDAARQNAEYAIVSTDHEMETEDDLIEVEIRAKDIGDSGDITGFEDLEIEWDPTKLELQTIEPNVLGAIMADDEDFEVKTQTSGYANVEWWPDSLDTIIDTLAPYIEDDVDDDVWPQFDDDPLLTMVFEPGDLAEVDDTTSVDVVDVDTVREGNTRLETYDNDDIYLGYNEVEFIPEPLEPAVDNATGSFTATSTGGFVHFGDDDRPDRSEALAEFEWDDREVIIEGDYNDSGVWAAEPDDVMIPDVHTRTDTGVPAEVVVDEPFVGGIDTETDQMWLDYEFEVYVPDPLDEGFSFPVNLTTGESAELNGEASFDVDPETYAGDGEANLVDNEFIVPEEEIEDTSETMREEANLEDADQPGYNWFVLELDFEFEEFVGEESTLDATVVDEDGEPIENALVDVVDDPTTDGMTDEDGSLELEGIEPGEQDITLQAEGYLEEEFTVEFEALETEERTFELRSGTPNLEVNMSVAEEVPAEETTQIVLDLENTGDGIADQTVELTADDEVLLSEDVQLGVDVENDEIDELDHTETLTYDWEPQETGTIVVQAASDQDVAVEQVEVSDDLDMMGITFTGDDGFISFAEETQDEALEEGLLFPDDFVDSSTEIEIEGLLFPDGSWQSTSASFPDLEIVLDEDSGDSIVAEVDVPGGFTGELDTETDEVSIEATFAVDADGDSFEFDVAGTSGDSGELSGGADLDAEGGEVTLVDNEYLVVDETGNSVLDGALDLPIEEEGLNWLEVVFDVEIDDEVEDVGFGDLDVTVVDEAGDPVDDATVEVEGTEEVTDSTGDVAFEELPAGDVDVTVSADGYEETTVEVTVEADETTAHEVTLEAGEAEFEVDADGDVVTEGDTVEVEATVENVGSDTGESTVTLALEDETLEETVELDPEEAETVTMEWETAEGDAGEYEFEATAGDVSATDEVVVNEEAEGDSMFTAKSTGGWISFTEDTQEQAHEEALEFPSAEEGDEYIEIQGVIEDGEWESTYVDFPDLTVPDVGLNAMVETAGLSGEIDEETMEMTAAGTLEVDIEGEAQMEFDIGATTDGSGELSGEAADDEVVLVDNEFVVPEETGNPLIDGSLSLPADDPGENWLVLEMDTDVQEMGTPDDAGTVEGVVESEAGDAIAEATVDVEGEMAAAETDSDGGYELEVGAGTHDIVVEASGYEPETMTVDVSEDETTTQDVILAEGEAAFETSLDDIDASPGTTTVSGEIENVGTATGTTDATLSVAEESVEETVELAPGESETIEMDVELDEDADYDATLSAGDESSASASIVADDGTDAEVDGDLEFIATSTVTTYDIDGEASDAGGWISFGEDEDVALEEGLLLPPNDDTENVVQISGVIDEDTGEWESTDTDFPSLYVEDIDLWAGVETHEGFHGEIDLETGEMTVEGAIEVEVDGDTFTFDIGATTGDSGALSGSTDLDEEGGAVTLVDNEYIVDDETGSAIIDGALPLPSTDEGSNWFELNMDIEIDDDVGDLDEQEDPDDDEDDSSFIGAFGQLLGMVGLAAALFLVIGSLVGRFATMMSFDL